MNGQRQHFWVASSRYFETTLFVVPTIDIEKSSSEPTKISLFDSDGELFNELELRLEGGNHGCLELEQFLGACKLESGIKHAHAIVDPGAGARCVCRIHSREGASFMGEASRVTADRGAFFPTTISSGVSPYLALVNCGSVPTELRCRLFCGKRTPEIAVVLPGGGSRFIGIQQEFAAFLDGESAQAYLRISTRSTAGIGAQLLESYEGQQGGLLYCTVS